MPISYLLLVPLIAGVLFVNGFTDAPGAITSVVCTGTLSFRQAVLLAAACNVAGLLIGWRFAPMVQNTLCEMADFSGAGRDAAMAAITAAMAAIVLFAITAWAFGIPTSESHALIAALTGAALALGGSQAVSRGAWRKALLGLLLSSLGGLIAGYLAGAWTSRLKDRTRPQTARRIQLCSTALLAALHGAQDGLKFTAMLVMADALLLGERPLKGVDLSGRIETVVFCAAVMALGTLCGGRKIIETVGQRMVQLDEDAGAASDLSACALLLSATLLGLPASTTHTKTCAVLGAGIAAGRPVSAGAFGEVALAWIITFPACGLMGWLLTRLLTG